MIRTIGGLEAFVVVISAGRPEAVEPMTEAFGPATWVVPDGEGYDVEPTVSQPGNSVARARNIALEAGIDSGRVTVMLDDDFLRSARLVDGQRIPTDPVELMSDMLQRLDLSDFRLAATNRGANPFYARKATTTRASIWGGCLGIKRTNLRFDETLDQVEDFDYGVQHIEEYGGLVRCNDLSLEFDMYQPGGLSHTRSPSWSREVCERVAAKWPGVVEVIRADKGHDPTGIDPWRPRLIGGRVL